MSVENLEGPAMVSEMWSDIRARLASSVGQHNVERWIDPISLTQMSAGVAEFSVPSRFIANYISQNFTDQLLYELREHDPNIRRLIFSPEQKMKTGKIHPVQSEERLNRAEAEVPPHTHLVRPRASNMLAAAPLDPGMRFEYFVAGNSNQLALSAAKRVASGAPVAFNPLFIYGDVGLGKTHLMHAIAWELQSSAPQLNVLYLSAEQFMYRFVKALRERQMMDFKAIFRAIDVFIIDDFQFIAGKGSTQEEFFHTFNALVSENKQVVIAADSAPGDIKDLDERLRSRLQSGLVVDIEPADYELRLNLLKQKSEFLAPNFPDVRIGEQVLETIAERVTTSNRALQGALNRLLAFGSMLERDADLELMESCLSDLFKSSARKIGIEDIQGCVCKHYNISLTDMLGPRRLRRFSQPRQIAMHLCKELTTRSFPEIGRHFGGRDHTTVIHALKRVEALIESDPQISDDIDVIKKQLKG